MKEFSAERWIGFTKRIAESKDAIDVDAWVSFLFETTNLFKKMGSAMSMAFSGMLYKFNCLHELKNQYLSIFRYYLKSRDYS